MDIKEIKAIVDLMKKNSMTEFEMEKGDFKIRLQRDANSGKRGQSSEPMVVQAQPVVQAAPAPVAHPSHAGLLGARQGTRARLSDGAWACAQDTG